ncbi:unnamed protein product [Clavelina lepadiformis]|uniref:ubiquitinyl hydrolase 1 n=1 Tax=Clavelina lepadiformis TaxID=159417 RepID=A0ABP0GZS5_CLALP
MYYAELFDNYMQHDAHELFNHLLNSIHLVLVEERKAERERKRLLEQHAAAGNGIKKERTSFFGRSRKEKPALTQNSLKTMDILPEVSADASTGNGDTTTSTDHSGSLSSVGTSESPSFSAENTLNLNDLLNHKQGLVDNSRAAPVNGNTSEEESVPVKSSSFSFFSRAKHNKKTPSSFKSSDNGDSFKAANSYTEEYDEDTKTWINDIFQGTYTTITRCLTCETVKNKDEDFLDLSVDIEQNTSITHCLRVFSNQQILSGEHKYSCEVCRSKQEAQIQMRIKKLPMILALHLKRFKYCDTLNKYTKLTYRVVFPFELRLFNTTDDASNPERLYDLIAVVVHCGSGPYRGHYVSIVKSHGMWLLFDDDTVEKLEPSGMEDFYGVTADKNSESGYILFYQSKE